MESQQVNTLVVQYDTPPMLTEQAYAQLLAQQAASQNTAANSPSVAMDVLGKGRKPKSNHSNCEHKVRVRNSTYNALKELSAKENKAMSVIIDQLVQDRIMGVPAVQAAVPMHMPAAYQEVAVEDMPGSVHELQQLVQNLRKENNALKSDLAQKHQDINSMMVDIAGLSAHLEQVCGMQNNMQHAPQQFVSYDMSAAATYTHVGEQRPSPTSMQALPRTASGALSDRNSPSGRMILPVGHLAPAHAVQQAGDAGAVAQEWVAATLPDSTAYFQYGHTVAPTYDRVGLVQADGCRSVLESAERQAGIDIQLINGGNMPAIPTGTVILAPEVMQALPPAAVLPGNAEAVLHTVLGHQSYAGVPGTPDGGQAVFNVQLQQQAGRKRSAQDMAGETQEQQQ